MSVELSKDCFGVRVSARSLTLVKTIVFVGGKGTGLRSPNNQRTERLKIQYQFPTFGSA